MTIQLRPVYDVAGALWPLKTESYILDLSATSAYTVWVQCFQVAGGIRRKIWGISAPALSTDSTGLYIAAKTPQAGGGDPPRYTDTIRVCAWSTVALYMTTVAGIVPITLDPGWVVGTWNTANAGDSARRITFLISEEAYLG